MTAEEYRKALSGFMTFLKKEDPSSYRALMSMDSEVFSFAVTEFVRALGVIVTE